MKELIEYERRLERLKGQKHQLLKQLDETNKSFSFNQREKRFIDQAQVLLQLVAQNTQKELEYYISDIVSLALSIVFEHPYELKLEFVVRRGKTEADIWFVRNGEKCEPLLASGGGVIDIASFALRVALWNLSHKKLRNVLILDEPFKFLSVDLQQKAGQMLRQISRKLGLQIIMVSHIPDLIEYADKVFEIKR